MFSNFEILRKNKLVALVVMFLVIGVVVWVLDMIHGYSLFETFTSKLICNEHGPDSNECKKSLNETMN